MKTITHSDLRRGFSLVELLVVVAVIGMMAALVLPQMSQMRETVIKARQKRNAQSLAQTTNAALAAGATIDLSSFNTMLAAMNSGVPGVTSMNNLIFKVPGCASWSSDDQAAISNMLVINASESVIEYRGFTSAD